jgi:[ribosomal protein S5]-alanine N-acetyltransferase
MLEPNFNPFPELKTRRLLLRRMTIDDANVVFFLRNDERVMKYIDREPTNSMEDVEAFIQGINSNIDNNYAVMWALALPEDPSKMIGLICLWQIKREDYRAEVGFTLHPDHWRKGLMKEALVKVIEYGFATLRLHSIEGQINPANEASAAILESVRFVKEGHYKEDHFFRGKFLDTAVYSLINEYPLV